MRWIVLAAGLVVAAGCVEQPVQQSAAVQQQKQMRAQHLKESVVRGYDACDRKGIARGNLEFSNCVLPYLDGDFAAKLRTMERPYVLLDIFHTSLTRPKAR